MAAGVGPVPMNDTAARSRRHSSVWAHAADTIVVRRVRADRLGTGMGAEKHFDRWGNCRIFSSSFAADLRDVSQRVYVERCRESKEFPGRSSAGLEMKLR